MYILSCCFYCSFCCHKKSKYLAYITLLLLLCPPTVLFCDAQTTATSTTATLRVFVLAGQSNMQGFASVAHLEALVADSETRSEYEHLLSIDNDSSDSRNKWRIRENDVYMIWYDGETVFPLTVGLGKTHGSKFGPELEFGHVLGDYFSNNSGQIGDPVLLIKSAYGGTSLAVDWRPPSSGSVPKIDYLDGIDLSDSPFDETNIYGSRYRQMISTIRFVLANVRQLLPDNVATFSNISIEGFVWFQGFQDVLDVRKIQEYENNLINFLQDVRTDLNIPDLPYIIGELGMEGWYTENQNHLQIRQIQRRVATMFSAKFVETKRYVYADLERFDSPSHYYGRADTIIRIGRDFGHAAIQAINPTPTTMFPTFSPSELPTTTPSSQAPSNRPSDYPSPFPTTSDYLNDFGVCDDDNTKSFFVPDLNQCQRCIWLASRPQYQKIFCDPSHESGVYELCEETCGRCRDGCLESSNQAVIIDGVNRTCGWFSVQLHIHQRLCVPTEEVYQKCPETCNACDIRTTIAPTTSPAPTVTPEAYCDDDLSKTFFVQDLGIYEGCIWLAGRPNYQTFICQPNHPSNAFTLCAETCGKCVDNCNDSTTGAFVYNEISRMCSWLALRPSVQQVVCQPGSEAYVICPESCDACDNNPPTTITISPAPSFLPTSIAVCTTSPTTMPSIYPTTSQQPSQFPSSTPSTSPKPSVSPSLSKSPSHLPSHLPSLQPSESKIPSMTPSISISPTVTYTPSTVPSITQIPSIKPTPLPSTSALPSNLPTVTSQPTATTRPTASPPSNMPSTSQPTELGGPTLEPTTRTPVTQSPITLAPVLPALTASPVQHQFVCDDDRYGIFMTLEGQYQKCVWLSSRPSEQTTYCGEGQPAREICPETCRVCNDDCENTDESFVYNGHLRSCLWLSLRNNIIDIVCTPLHEAYSVCPEACNACDEPLLVLPQVTTTPAYPARQEEQTLTPSTLNPSRSSTKAIILPTTGTPSKSMSISPTPLSRPSEWPSRLPSRPQSVASADPSSVSPVAIMPTNAAALSPVEGVSKYVCDDDRFGLFVVANGDNQRCVWLSSRYSEQEIYCRPGQPARMICPETCGVCTDDCEDDTITGSFIYQGIERDCLWLSLRNNMIDEVCTVGSDAYISCPETCDACDEILTLFDQPTRSPSASVTTATTIFSTFLITSDPTINPTTSPTPRPSAPVEPSTGSPTETCFQEGSPCAFHRDCCFGYCSEEWLCRIL